MGAPMQIPVPITRRANESEKAYLTRLMLSLYGRPVSIVHPIGRDGFQRSPKTLKVV